MDHKKGKKQYMPTKKEIEMGAGFFLGEERVKQEWKEGHEGNGNKSHYIQVWNCPRVFEEGISIKTNNLYYLMGK